MEHIQTSQLCRNLRRKWNSWQSRKSQFQAIQDDLFSNPRWSLRVKMKRKTFCWILGVAVSLKHPWRGYFLFKYVLCQSIGNCLGITWKFWFDSMSCLYISTFVLSLGVFVRWNHTKSVAEGENEYRSSEAQVRPLSIRQPLHTLPVKVDFVAWYDVKIQVTSMKQNQNFMVLALKFLSIHKLNGYYETILFTILYYGKKNKPTA